MKCSGSVFEDKGFKITLQEDFKTMLILIMITRHN